MPSVSKNKVQAVEYNVLKASQGENPWSNLGTIFIGIDPGVSGGIAVLKGKTVEWFPMPDTERDVWNLIRQFQGVTSGCCIERIVPNLWGAGKASVAKLYGSYMALRMALTAAGIVFEEIEPKDWQRALGVPPRKRGKRQKVKNKKGKIVVKEVGGESSSDYKSHLRERCRQLFPRIALWERPKGEQMAVCDSILLAEFCRRRVSGS